MVEIKNELSFGCNNIWNKKWKLIKLISWVSLSLSILFSPNVSAAFNNNSYNTWLAIAELNKIYIAYKNLDDSKKWDAYKLELIKLIKLIENNWWSNHSLYNQVKQEIFGQINQPRY